MMAPNEICARVQELLPWWLNGSLEAADRREVEDHLAACAGCRAELEGTRAAWAIFATHLPAADVAAYGLGLVPGMKQARIEMHLAGCGDCSAEAARVGRAARGADGPSPRRAARSPWAAGGLPWAPLALAAGLVLGFGLGGWWFGAGSAGDPSRWADRRPVEAPQVEASDTVFVHDFESASLERWSQRKHGQGRAESL
jgi:hypothetical protein